VTRRSPPFFFVFVVAVVVSFVVAIPSVFAQFGNKPTRPSVQSPKGPVRQVILKHCTMCHGIDDYAYNALDRGGWNALLDAKHENMASLVSSKDRDLLLDWLVTKFGPSTKPFPRTYVPPEITTYFSDSEANALTARACVGCHNIDRVNDARYSPDRWRVVTVDMRERGAKLSDEELERLVEWLGRTKGTNPNQ
jgi:cytochrome c553